MVRLSVLFVCLVACGGARSTTSSESDRKQETGDRRQETGDAPDAGGPVAEVTADAGPPVVYPDAGLMELGAAQCDMVIARLIACPKISAGDKQFLRDKQEEIRKRAADPKNREEVAATCRQLVEVMEEKLRRLSC